MQCPNCNQKDFESALHQSEGNIDYQELSKFNELFFELIFGEIYECDVIYNGKIEKTTIVPINSNPKFNQLFFIFDITYCRQNNPNIIEILMKKSFSFHGWNPWSILLGLLLAIGLIANVKKLDFTVNSAAFIILPCFVTKKMV